ncbi:Regulator of chromosome condensation/beta-lactamase-inhibitor protein II [Metarhizium album ARSEF 1941]|uniref:Regulator of chromosome condensation/beta-lactamase-inhibitor protein II n=1 Tax=Metarhizium album (strain ARSEF 1941) TaxID=1081103 RepID=A0A0B2WWH0_METAS|nr:Regulator of chromosome condensation/beta-lactamase-inhibitor protein II [Metarhizium album ARSEF 1941]KHN97742.1 Regulator of chromosome condensation/beta-lactamase-inhibitor protein II [Metarhizium album ARSEF 1941]
MYAAGFNAWNQLCFAPRPQNDIEPEDLSTFTKVLHDDHLGRPRPGLHYTLVRGHAGYHCAGFGVQTASEGDFRHSYEACLASNGLTLTFGPPRTAARITNASPELNQHTLTVYPCYRDFVSKSNSTSWPCDSQVQEVAAFAAGFIILYKNGNVATMGDPRYQDCLAREITSDEPASEPGLVPDLIDLGEPIKHVTAGGYCLAALTESGSIYIWGQKFSGSRQSGHSAFADLCDVPNYLGVDGDKDVQDVALGDSHAIALTTDGTVYVMGRNDNGQLGLGQGVNMDAKTWTKVGLGISADQVVGVAAGPKSSFILTAPRIA